MEKMNFKEKGRYMITDAPTNELMKLRGRVRFLQTDLEGNEIEGTRGEGTNTIYSKLKQNLAKAIVSETNTDYIDVESSSFTDEDADDFTTTTGETFAGLSGYGIALLAYDPGNECFFPKAAFVTSVNNGGDGNTNSVEFYGYFTAAGASLTINASTMKLYLVQDIKTYTVSTGSSGISLEAAAFTNIYASYSFTSNVTVEQNRRFHFYWTIEL